MNFLKNLTKRENQKDMRSSPGLLFQMPDKLIANIEQPKLEELLRGLSNAN
jgi:hypothetical protein